jgi:DNA polymerase
LTPKFLTARTTRFFEQLIVKNVLSGLFPKFPQLKSIPPPHWFCTAALAASNALPRSLEGAGAALSLPIQKDLVGHKLMLKMSKPRKPTKNDPRTRHNKLSDLKRLTEYCATDVIAERSIFLKLPPLSPTEKKVWELDQKINMRGFEVDRPLVDTALRLIAEETKALDAETVELTGGRIRSTTQRNETLTLVQELGVDLNTLQAKPVADALKGAIPNAKARRLLEIRQAISKTSTAKYKAFEMRSRSDSRLRDILLYNAAIPTARFGGRGVQPQNFPRGTIGNMVEASKIVACGDLEAIRMLYGKPMDVFSSVLRTMIKAPKGKKFISGDYNAIELRCAFWLADHAEGLQAFYENRDQYREMAMEIYSLKKVEQVTKFQRELGKRADLGCLYGMGSDKFHETCEKQGQPIDTKLAEKAVKAFREKHSPIPELWKKYEMAAISAIENPGKVFAINHTKWFMESRKSKYLYCELPSGRKMAYFGPEIKYEENRWGHKQAKVYHYGVDGYTKKWRKESKWGGVWVENVTQGVARDLMAEAMLRVEEAGYEVVLSVHDELLTEVPEDSKTLTVENFEKLMAELPAWAKGLPVKVEGWEDERYHK